MPKKRMVVPRGYVLIFRPYYLHRATKKRVYPKNGRVFPMLVRAKRK